MAPIAGAPTQQIQINPETLLRRGSCVPQTQQTQLKPEALLRRGSLPLTPTPGNFFPKFLIQKILLMNSPEGPKPFVRFSNFDSFSEKVTELVNKHDLCHCNYSFS